MNGHHFNTTVSNPDLPVVIHTQSHQIPFQECWYVSVIYKLPNSNLTTFTASLKQRTNSSYNHVTPLDSTYIKPHPHSTLPPTALTIPCESFLFYCWSKRLPSSFPTINSAGPMMQISSLGKCHSVFQSYLLSNQYHHHLPIR